MAFSLPRTHSLPRAGAAAQAAPSASPAVPVAPRSPAGRPDLLGSPMSWVALLTGPGTLAERLAEARMRPPL
jgi:hypothetical protein